MIDREDARALALLVARAETQAERMLLVALHHLEHRPKLRSRVDVDAHRIDLVVELDGRRLAVLLGRTGDQRTEADKARDAALERAGWAVYRQEPGRVLSKPQRAVGDLLAALHERGAPVPKREPASPAPWWTLDQDPREPSAEVGKLPVLNGDLACFGQANDVETGAASEPARAPTPLPPGGNEMNPRPTPFGRSDVAVEGQIRNLEPTSRAEVP